MGYYKKQQEVLDGQRGMPIEHQMLVDRNQPKPTSFNSLSAETRTNKTWAWYDTGVNGRCENGKPGTLWIAFRCGVVTDQEISAFRPSRSPFDPGEDFIKQTLEQSWIRNSTNG